MTTLAIAAAVLLCAAAVVLALAAGKPASFRVERAASIQAPPSSHGGAQRPPLLSRVMRVFMDMDEMIGGEFEKGLADLKRLAEA